LPANLPPLPPPAGKACPDALWVILAAALPLALVRRGCSAAKSFLLLQACLWWLDQGVSVALYELEEDREYWQHRALSLLAGDSRFADFKFLAQYPEAWRSAYETHAATIDRFTSCLTVEPERMPTHAEVLKWIADKAKKCDIVAIDPITAVEGTEKPWLADLFFIMEAKRIMRESGKRLILITHPKKARQHGSAGLEDLAGGAAYGRFVQTVLWVLTHYPPKELDVRFPTGFNGVEKCNRTIRLPKARNGMGTGWEFAFHMDPQTLRFVEYGMVAKD